jgi:dihydrodipicolinate synthase/N-acetylneuraminate lyase
MRPLSSEEISGTWATLLLPINQDDSIDFARLGEDIDYLLTTGVDGIYTNGTSGEFYSQTEDEFDRIHTLLAEKCEKVCMPFQIGASHMSAQVSLARVRRAAQLKAGAIQVILPDWFPVNSIEATVFLERVADVASPVGLVLYNPPHAKRVLQPEEYAHLAEAVPGLVGVKVVGEAMWYAELRRLAPRLSIFVPGHQLATGIRSGASGSYSNVACLHPVGAKRWNQLMSRDYGAALALEVRIGEFLEEFVSPWKRSGYSNQALDKLLAAVGGWSRAGTRLRWPYRWIDENRGRQLRPIARERLPELFPC